MKSSAAILLLSLLGAVAGATTPDSLFPADGHCVAYKARKTMFLVSANDVVGKNCDISAQVLPEVGGLYRIEVNVPLSGFQSGDSSRDEDVAKTLKSDVRSELLFRSQAMSADQWHTLLRKPEFEVQGELTIGDKAYPVKLVSHYHDEPDGGEIDGEAHVHFEDFGIKPPTAGGGLVAKAKSELELHFQLQGSRILGADSIRPPAPKKETDDETPPSVDPPRRESVE